MFNEHNHKPTTREKAVYGLGIPIGLGIGLVTGLLLLDTCSTSNTEENQSFTPIELIDGDYRFRRIGPSQFEVIDNRGGNVLQDDRQEHLNEGVEIAQDEYGCDVREQENNERNHSVIITVDDAGCIFEARDRQQDSE